MSERITPGKGEKQEQIERIRRYEALLDRLSEAVKKYKEAGKKCIGVLPYYAPEELVFAAGMVPMGMWGSNRKTIARAKEYCATFYCTIAQLALEMLLDGTDVAVIATGPASNRALEAAEAFPGKVAVYHFPSSSRLTRRRLTPSPGVSAK